MNPCGGIRPHVGKCCFLQVLKKEPDNCLSEKHLMHFSALKQVTWLSFRVLDFCDWYQMLEHFSFTSVSPVVSDGLVLASTFWKTLRCRKKPWEWSLLSHYMLLFSIFTAKSPNWEVEIQSSFHLLFPFFSLKSSGCRNPGVRKVPTYLCQQNNRYYFFCFKGEILPHQQS